MRVRTTNGSELERETVGKRLRNGFELSRLDRRSPCKRSESREVSWTDTSRCALGLAQVALQAPWRELQAGPPRRRLRLLLCRCAAPGSWRCPWLAREPFRALHACTTAAGDIPIGHPE